MTDIESSMNAPIGKVWAAKDLPADIVADSYQKSIVTKAVDFLSKKPSRSVLISGDRGTGKSTIINLIAKELESKHWHIVVAAALDIVAGQMYIGMMDRRIQNLITTLTQKKKSIWLVPKFQELFYTGKTIQNPSGILDRFLPHIEKGDIGVLGEIDSSDLEKILRYRPQLKTEMEIIRLEPPSQDDTVSLAKKWCALPRNAERWNGIKENDLHEASKFARQFLGFTKEPGNLFSFLKVTQAVVEAKKEAGGKARVTADDFMLSLSAITGLPLSILDDRKKLDIEELKRQFFNRVIGQDEAVNTIIERIAMIKAGFTDPTRPLGVFLFVGPTGTGKTEIAKTLAEFLFGSDDRMIRLDMSEFKAPDSLERLIGAGHDDSVSLVNEIRKNPFSVLLLDEFEKAHSNIWDLFLQLFDDGRLTDNSGNTADFRHAIIIMTSNLGASIPTGHKIGFGQGSQEFDPRIIAKTLNKTFKAEFINRIDRIVTFNPLNKATMRQILKGELKRVLERRGFRQRQWAFEWDESAIEFLLEKGFTAHLGARPMKRAVEQYLLAPLAMTIVTHQFPEGDQFLFVRKNGNQLQVDFIDPDAPALDWKERKKSEETQHEKAKHLTLKKIALDPQGTPPELEVVQKEITAFSKETQSSEWVGKKESHLKKMAEPDFWNSDNKKEILSEIEYRDRFEESLSTVISISERLADLKKTHKTLPPQLIKQVAERLILMQMSLDAFKRDTSQDALLRVFYEPVKRATETQVPEFWEKLVKMYSQWAKKRKMTCETIVQEISNEGHEFIMSVEGFAAFQVLEHERGIHVWEHLKNENKYDRTRVRVDVITFPEGDVNSGSLSAKAKQLFSPQASGSTRIARRYRDKPSALVRDDVMNWRSGRLDKVLAGDFDLME